MPVGDRRALGRRRDGATSRVHLRSSAPIIEAKHLAPFWQGADRSNHTNLTNMRTWISSHSKSALVRLLAGSSDWRSGHSRSQKAVARPPSAVSRPSALPLMIGEPGVTVPQLYMLCNRLSSVYYLSALALSPSLMSLRPLSETPLSLKLCEPAQHAWRTPHHPTMLCRLVRPPHAQRAATCPAGTVRAAGRSTSRPSTSCESSCHR